MDIKNNQELQNFPRKIEYLVISGSRAYGTHHENSDYDLRGFFLESKQDLLGLTAPKEDYVLENSDTVLYSFNKFIKLLSACNPNVIELIGVRENEIIQISDLGREVRDNSQLFLSKRCFKSFINYANAQLRRLENALARDSYNEHDKQKHIIKSIETQLLSNQMPEGIHPESFSFSLQDNIHVSVNLKDVPLNSFLATQSLISNTVRNFGKLNHRNHKKDEYHLNKHAMHLIRLYLMGIEILESGEINTYREKDRDLLLSIKNGEMPYQDVFKLQAELETKIKKAYDTSKLPKQVDLDKISDFVFRMHDTYLE